MTKKGVKFSEIKIIMAHTQVFKQCQKKLSLKYPDILQKTGEGEYVDHAKVAESISNGKIKESTAVMGSKSLAEIYNLEIIESNLQDSDENFTTSFLLCKKFI